MGLLETMVEYYTGRDASTMTDDELFKKLAHIATIRKLEGGEPKAK